MLPLRTIAIVAAVALGPLAARAEPPAGTPWKLVFRDEFDGKTADLDKTWDFQNAPSTHILCSRWRENVVVENGVCRLLNKKQNRGGQEWTSGSLWTKKQFKYGYFECRYKYGAASGLNNSFWIMTRGPERSEAPVRFEIDINEGHFPCEIATNIHRWSGKHVSFSRRFKLDNDPKYSVASAQSDSRGKKIDLSRDFHVYGLEWNERELVYYFDGKELRRAPNEFCHGEAPVWLSSAIITWAGPVTDAIDGTSMDVDYVRVYQRPK